MALPEVPHGSAQLRVVLNQDIARGNAQELAVAGHAQAITDLQAATTLLSVDKLPVAPFVNLQNDYQATRDDVVRDDARPGDAPRTFANTLAGGPVEALGPLPPAGSVVSAAGAVWPLYGEGAVVERGYTAIDPGRVYAVRGDVERIVNAIDPDGDAVRLGIAWYNASKALIGLTSLYEWKTDTVPLTTVAGRQMMTKRVARAAGAGIDFAAPAGTVYGRAFIQVFGGTQRTDVIRLQVSDVTDQNAWSPDVSGIDGRLTALESENLPAQIADIVATLDDPNSATYATVNDAATASVPAGVDLIRVLGQANPGDTGVAKSHRAEVAEPGTQGSFQDAGGRWWRPGEDRGPIVIGAEYLVKLRNSIASGNSGDGSKTHVDFFGNSLVALGGFDGGLDKIMAELRESSGLANLVFHWHGVSGSGWENMNPALVHPYSAASFVLYDINDISVSVAYCEEKARASIAALRALKPFGTHDIIVVGAPSTHDPANNRDFHRHEQLRGMRERLCRDFKVCVVDTYATMPDSRDLGGLVMDTPPVHPWLSLARRIWGQVWGAVFLREEMSYRAKNKVRNILYDAATSPSGDDDPGQQDDGITLRRVTPDDDYPVNGMAVELGQVDGAILNIVSSIAVPETRVGFRTNTAVGPNSSAALDWTDWLWLYDHDRAWTASAPTVTSSAVSGGPTYPAASCAMRHRKIGRMVHFTATITVAANNHGSGSLLLTMPFEAVVGNVFIARESATSGLACIAQILGGTSTVAIVTTANGYPAANGSVITVSGCYEAAA